ncbi:hypothetical protein E2542_SST05728 [Spatholobus suberectus]|nr:hypothetical protein E2542_SST05728 [Spatholobus suberectus]
MGRSCLPKCKLARIMGWMQIILGGLVILVSILNLTRFYSVGFFLHNEDICEHFYNVRNVYDSFDAKSLFDRVGEVIDRLETLQGKLESKVQEMEKNKGTLLEKKFLEDQIVRPLHSANVALRQIRVPKIDEGKNSTMKEDPLINFLCH